jgi:hypothetical protein
MASETFPISFELVDASGRVISRHSVRSEAEKSLTVEAFRRVHGDGFTVRDDDGNAWFAGWLADNSDTVNAAGAPV